MTLSSGFHSGKYLLPERQYQMKKSYIYLILALLITVFIFSNSMQTADESSKISGGLLLAITQITEKFHFSVTHNFLRKAAHFTEFFAQGVFLTLFFKNTRFRLSGGAVYAAFFGLLTACCDEFIQLFYDGRGSQVSDVFIDFSGTVMSILIIALIFCFKRRKKLC